MSDENTKFTPPPREISITLDGESREIRMSFGLQRELVAAVGAFENLTAAIMDPDLIVQLMGIALTKREKNGKPTEKKLYDASYADISDDDREALMLWIYGHVTDFFMRRLQAMESVMETAGPEFARLNSSAIGLRDSILRQPAPGHSTPSPAS